MAKKINVEQVIEFLDLQLATLNLSKVVKNVPDVKSNVEVNNPIADSSTLDSLRLEVTNSIDAVANSIVEISNTAILETVTPIVEDATPIVETVTPIVKIVTPIVKVNDLIIEANNDIVKDQIEEKKECLQKDQDMMLVFVAPADDVRSCVHDFLETKYKGLQKTSIYVCSFYANTLHIYADCWMCGKKVHLKNYREGATASNIDEYFWGKCKKCGEKREFEPNYEGEVGIKRIHNNNAVIVGSWSKEYYGGWRCRYDGKSILPVDWTKDCIFFLIPTPTKRLNREELQKYVADLLHP